jgi:hypothetical protein
MLSMWKRYARWLHTRWPAGTVERLPELGPEGTTSVPGIYVSGDLTGLPLLKFALESGVRAVRAMAAEPGFAAGRRAAAGDAPGALLDVSWAPPSPASRRRWRPRRSGSPTS